MGRYDRLFECLSHIRASGREWPVLKVKLECGMELRIALSRAGDVIYLDDGWSPSKASRKALGLLRRGDPGKGHWHGYTGVLAAPEKLELWSFMVALAADPVDALDRIGQKLGWCAVCGKELSAEESVSRGIGPRCWERLTGG